MRWFLFFAFWFMLLCANQAMAEPIPSGRLISDPAAFNTREIEFTGEAVGEVMKRGENGWVNINDGENAIGVYAGRQLLDAISTTGAYRRSGDIVSVMGTFNAVCETHGGDMDIHAKSLRVERSGKALPGQTDKRKFLALAMLSMVTGAVWISSRSGKK